MDDAAVLKRRGYIMGINLGEGSYAKVKSAYSERLKFNVAVKIDLSCGFFKDGLFNVYVGLISSLLSIFIMKNV